MKHLGGGTAFALGSGNTVYARNLSPDATGMKLTEAEFVEVMETGKDFKKPTESLLVMPWAYFRWMSAADKKALYAYLKAIPAVPNPVANDIKGALASPAVALPATYNEGDVDRPLPPAGVQDPNNVLRGLAIQPLAEPAALAGLSVADQAAYGRGSYLVNAQSHCSDCHTNPPRDRLPPSPTYLKITTAAYLTGGAVFATPPGFNMATKQQRTMSENLIGQSNGYFSSPSGTFSGFLTTITQSKHLDRAGNPALGFPMPSAAFAKLTISDLEAIYVYVANQRRATGQADKRTQAWARYCGADADCSTAAGETCAVATHECTGKACGDDSDCDACQTCTGAGVCAAPLASSMCLTRGL